MHYETMDDVLDRIKFNKEEEMMSEDNIKAKLADLDSAESRLDVLQMELERLRGEILTEEIKSELEALELEFKPGLEAVQEEIGRIKAEIKQMVLQHGSSVKAEVAPGVERSAIWVKGRTSWDTKKLEGYALAHPELLDLKKTGDPSVRFK